MSMTPHEAVREARWPFQTGPIAALLHARDWARTPLGPLASWPQSLRTAIDICLAWPEPASILWGAELIQIYNEPYARAPRVRHPAMFGGPLLENWPADRDILSRAITEIRADGQPLVSTEHAVAVEGAAGPDVRTFTFTFAPIRDESGAIGGLLHTAVETTARTRAEAALREGEARLRLALDVAEIGTWSWDLATGVGSLDARGAAIVGLTAGGLDNVAEAQRASIHPDDRARIEREVAAGVASGVAFSLNYRVVHPDGSVHHIASRARPLADETGRHTRLLGTNRDVTAEREAEAALRESEQRFRIMADTIPELIWLTDASGTVEFLNRRWLEYAGVSDRPTTAAQIAAESIHPDDAPMVIATFNEARRVGKPFEIEQRNRAATGDYRWFLNRAAPYRDPRTGAITRWIGVGIDIHDRKAAEAALRASEARQAFLLALNDRLRPLADPEAIQDEASRALGEYLGASRVGYAENQPDDETIIIRQHYTAGVADIAGRYRYDDYGRDLLRMFRAGRVVVRADIANDPALTDAEKAAHARLQLGASANLPLLKDGHLKAVLFLHYTTAHRFTADELALLGEVADRTWEAIVRARAEAALRDSEALFRQFGAASADPLWVRDAATMRFAYRSPAFATHYGIDPARLPDDADLDAWVALVHPADRARVLAALERVRRGERVVNEFRIARPDTGEERWLRDATFPLLDAAGRVQRIGGITRDVTERRRIGAEREHLLAAERAARTQAEEAVRARDTFLSIAAHELRTPLTTLKGTTQLLRRRHDGGTLGTERLAAGLAALDQSADRLTALTADLLDVARIRTGQLPLDPRPLDLAALVAGAVAVARDRAGDEHRLRLEAAADLAPVRADSGRIEQVLTNLLDNAIKYSPEGGTVGVTVRADGAGVAVAVRDRGIGLPPGATEAIFTPFGRAANAAASSLPGMGLGLFICRSIVARHGGWIRAASDGEGRGTVMTLWLPTAGPSDTAATDAAAP